MARPVSNPLALAVLAYLSRTPMHPYELGRTLREHGKQRSLKFTNGSLYMVVGQLTKAGLVVEHETSRAGNRPERTVYTLTEAGRAEWRSWLGELVSEPRLEQPHFVVALSLIAGLAPAEVVPLLEARRARVDQQRAEIRELMAHASSVGVHPLFQVDEEYRLALLDAEAVFLTGFVTRIVDPDDGWQGPWSAYLEGEHS